MVQLEVPRDHFARARHKVARRYSEFEKLHEALSKAWGKQAHRSWRAGGVGGTRARPSDRRPLTPAAPHTHAGRRPP